MRTLRFDGSLPPTLMENAGAGGWAGSLQLLGDPSEIAFVDVVGSADLFIEANYDAATGTVLLANLARPDYEAFSSTGAAPVLNFSLRAFMRDGTQAVSDTSWSLNVGDVNDTPPQGLYFYAGGSVAPGEIGVRIGQLGVVDPDSPVWSSFTVNEVDAWQYEVVGDSLKLRDGVTVAISDGPYRAILVDVSDGQQSAALRLNIRIESPAGEQSVLDVLDPWETRSGFSYKSPGTVWAERGAWEIERIERYGEDLTNITLKDGAQLWLPSLDRIELLNGVIDMREDSTVVFANSVYKAVLGRTVEGSFLWQLASDLDKGVIGREQLATILLESGEYAGRYGTLNNEQFIRTLYRNTEGGTPYEPGVQYWINALDTGTPRSSAVMGFAGWEVALNNLAAANPNGWWLERPNARIVSAIYDVALDRLPEREGFEYWMGNLSAGLLAPKDLAKLFGQSAEFLGRFSTMTEEQFVRELYREALGREPDIDGFNYWVGHLTRGTLARNDMVESFGFSNEKQGQLAVLPLGEPFI